jgi:hypothetical protein
MSHSASTVYMGSTQSNIKEVDNYSGAPTTFLAGLCVHLKSDGALSLAAADGSKLGISLGRSLSDTNRTSVCRKGLRVPILLANGFTPTVGAQVQISTTTGKAVSSGTAVNAVYVTAVLTAYDEAGAAISDGAALIDFQGGL